MKTDELLYLRGVIDDLDRVLIQVLAGRFRVTERIGQIKGEHALPVRDEQREKEHIAQVRESAMASDLEPDIAENVIKIVMSEATERHKRWQKT